MSDFNIVKTAELDDTYRVAKIMADFDIKPEHIAERFKGNIDPGDDWSIGIIVGSSGSGKTTIARTLYPNDIIKGFDYSAKSVIDDMPKDKNVEEISRMFYSVGFGSVPSWLKPYNVLSNGEKMRVDMARALLEKDVIVFDEFTSVVDRTVANTLSMAVSKAVRRSGKKFIAVTCHHDVVQWLEPDWMFDTDTMTFTEGGNERPKKSLPSDDASEANGQSLGDIII